MYAIAGSSSASGIPVSGGVSRGIVDIALNNYRGCKVDVLVEVVFSDAVIMLQAEYLLHYSGSSAKIRENTEMTSSYSSYGASLSSSVSYSNGVYTLSVTYTAAGSAESSGSAYSLVEIRGGYKSFSIYNS
mmetsp:Transcript_12457/g.29606  ORF Transcript_12457/g.29606 Transcript_12457/m.29606 type:complete len:131 (+) Transcript_12457:2-394(+)